MRESCAHDLIWEIGQNTAFPGLRIGSICNMHDWDGKPGEADTEE